jgi:hypothetical protein
MHNHASIEYLTTHHAAFLLTSLVLFLFRVPLEESSLIDSYTTAVNANSSLIVPPGLLSSLPAPSPRTLADPSSATKPTITFTNPSPTASRSPETDEMYPLQVRNQTSTIRSIAVTITSI